MNTKVAFPIDAARRGLTPQQIRDRVLAYYAAATPDYRVWSKDYNMHFGFWRLGLNPFDRESMLQELNAQVIARLALPTGSPVARLADLGGGTGATARAAVAATPNLVVDVVTIAPIQIEIGEALNAQAKRGEAIRMHCADYTHTPLPGASYDAVCMIESACHAEGATKPALLREAIRLLKPGGRLVLVDAMLVREMPSAGWMARLVNAVYRRWCDSWAVPEMCRLDLLPGALRAVGFERPTYQDWSWHIAPSVAHVPLFATYFALVEVIKARGVLPPWRWRHIVASLLTPLLGLRRCTFAYGVVTATKPFDSASAQPRC